MVSHRYPCEALLLTNVSIYRVPDVAPVKKKMVYAGSKDALSSALIGIMVKIQATDASELSEAKLLTECTKFN
jgi:hypothetical protein